MSAPEGKKESDPLSSNEFWGGVVMIIIALAIFSIPFSNSDAKDWQRDSAQATRALTLCVTNKEGPRGWRCQEALYNLPKDFSFR